MHVNPYGHAEARPLTTARGDHKTMLSAYITHADCARHDMGAHHPECPERLGAINDHLLVKGLLDYMIPYDAPMATEEQLGRAHASLYVREIFEASPKEGLHPVDPDTNMCPHTLTAALRAAGYHEPQGLGELGGRSDFGGAQVVLRDPAGRLIGGSDPRKDGMALAV